MSNAITDIPRFIKLKRGTPLRKFSSGAVQVERGQYSLGTGVYLRGVEDERNAEPAIWDVVWAASDEFADLLFNRRPVGSMQRTWPTPTEQYSWCLGSTYAAILERADKRYGRARVREGAAYRVIEDGGFMYRHLDTPDFQRYYFLSVQKLPDEEPFAISWRLKL